MRLIHTIDAHTAGEPVRIVTSGIPVLRGGSAREKRDDFAHRFDHLRAAILHEPRGHRDMFGAVLVPPDDGSDVHFAVFFMDNGGYLDMCGHGLIGVVTALLHQGVLDPGEYHGVVRCDTPAGLEGILGTVFRGRLVERVEVDGRTAVVPEVECESWLTGFHQFVIPEGDPLRSGFLL